MSTASILCLIGLPGSGKTTLASWLKACYAESGVKIACVEYDRYLDCSHGEWKRQRQKLLEDIRKLAGELKATGRRSVVILDDNFYYKSMRYEVYRIAKELRLGFGQICLNVPFDVCFSRNSSRPEPVPPEVLFRMRTLIEPPEPRKNSWEKYSLIFSTNPADLNQIYDLVVETWNHPFFPEPQMETPLHENSAIHYADLALRNIVKTVILSIPPKERPLITANLSQKKKSLLEDVKLRNIELPVVDSESDMVETYVKVLEKYFSDFLHT